MDRWKRKEMLEIFDSLEPELYEDMKRLDYRLRYIASECSMFGIPMEEINKEQRKRVYNLLDGIINENTKSIRKIGRRDLS